MYQNSLTRAATALLPDNRQWVFIGTINAAEI